MAPRILGRHVQLFVHSAKLALPISLGEIDEFSASSTTDIVKSRPIGYILEAATLRFSGYDLSFKIGKTNPMLERWNNLTDRGLITGTQPPELFITEKVNYQISPSIPIWECWTYKNVSLFAPDVSVNSDEYTQTIKGFAPYKELSEADISYLKFAPQMAFQEAVFRTKDDDFNLTKASSEFYNNIIDGIIKQAQPGG